MHFHHIGKRVKQEDGYWVSGDHKLFAVCDGVGGSSNGELASRTILESIAQQYADRHSKNLDDDSENTILNYILAAQDDLHAFVFQRPEHRGIATTLALLHLEDKKATISHLGDSKIIYIEKETGAWISTKDHSAVQELLDAGLISNERAMKEHPEKNIISKCLSGKKKITKDEMTTSEITNCHQGDLFLIATDGALEHHTNSELVSIFTENKPVTEQWKLFRQLCELNSSDNNTAILIEL